MDKQYTWDVRVTSAPPAGTDLLALEDVFFDALQGADGIDLWTTTVDAEVGTISAHFGVAAAEPLPVWDVAKLGSVAFGVAAEVVGWAVEFGKVAVGEAVSSTEITVAGPLAVESPVAIAV